MASGGRVSEVRGEQASETQSLRWPEAVLPVRATSEGEAGAVEVALLWGDRLLDVKQFPRGAWPTLGHLPHDSMHVFAKNVGASFPLLREVNGERVLSVPVGARVAIFGQRTLDDVALTAGGFLRESDERPGREVELRPGERALVSMGALQIAVRDVPRAPRVSIRTLTDLDFGFFKLFAVTTLIAAAFVTILLLPGTATSLVDDSVFGGRPDIVKVVLKNAPKPPEKPKAIDIQATPSTTTRPEVATNTPSAPKRTRKADDVIKQIFGDPKLAQGGIFGGGSGLGDTINTALGNLGRGGTFGDSNGLGGFGARGTGAGGPGTGLGIGGVGGTCDANCRAARYHGTDLEGGLRQKVNVVTSGKTTVIGGLDKDVIAKIIQRHQSEIKACYERSLTESPDLAGKVAVAFTIDATGGVSQAIVSESSIESAAVEQCMLSRIQRWKFPEPRGGGEVSVNYPWIFHPAGTDAE